MSDSSVQTIPGMQPENYPRERKEDVPILDIQFPRRASAIHQIEVTSRCNLRCRYCIHPSMSRPKQDMPMAIFDRALDHACYFQAGGTQAQINLSGTGEPTMHPHLESMLRRVRHRLGWDIKITLTTNGVGYPKHEAAAAAYIKRLAAFKPSVWVSLHRPEVAQPISLLWRSAGCLEGLSQDPVLNSNDWAGQVDWPIVHQFALPCMWLRQGYVFVESDGSVATCCLDGDGAPDKGGKSMMVGHVNDPLGSLRTAPGPLCADCHQMVGVKGLEHLDQKVVDSDASSAHRKLPVVK